MKKKLGGLARLGSVAQGTQGDGSKWVESIGDQVEGSADVKSINTKTIPVDSVRFTPGNPRELRITPEEIRENYSTLRLPPKALAEDSDDDWRDDYENLVTEVFPDPMKIADFMSIAKFAASLKSADRLLNPIVVWREETLFYKITGERRFLAHMLLGEPQIAARIYDWKPNEFEIATIQWEENYQREDLCLHDALVNLQQMIEGWKRVSGNDKITTAQFQNISGMSRANGARYLRILTHGTEKLWEAMRNRHVDTVETAYQLAALERGLCDKELDKIVKGEGTTARELARERAESGKRTRRARPTKMGRVPNFTNPTWVRRARPIEVKAARFLVGIFREGLKSKNLNEELDKLDLQTAKGVNAAFEELMKVATRMAGEGSQEGR